jgi:hypothetical protein
MIGMKKMMNNVNIVMSNITTIPDETDEETRNTLEILRTGMWSIYARIIDTANGSNELPIA